MEVDASLHAVWHDKMQHSGIVTAKCIKMNAMNNILPPPQGLTDTPGIDIMSF
jgi:hypothetical protein